MTVTWSLAQAADEALGDEASLTAAAPLGPVEQPFVQPGSQRRTGVALDYLERSRQRYTSLGLTIQAVLAEHELADTYLELNLAPEALAIYERVIPIFAQHGMRAEEARAQAYGRNDEAAAGRHPLLSTKHVRFGGSKFN